MQWSARIGLLLKVGSRVCYNSVDERLQWPLSHVLVAGREMRREAVSVALQCNTREWS